MRPRYIYSGIELELASSKVSTKVCGFTFGSISLHLISKRIKAESQHKNTNTMQNIYLDLIMKRLSGNKKNLYVFSRFQLYA